MKKIKFVSLMMSALLILGSCNMSNTAKGGIIGGGSGAAIGGVLGNIFSGKSDKGKGTAIGAAIGTAVGTGVGILIGKKMDKAKAAAEQVANAQVESIQDANGLQAVKVTFDYGILFDFNSSNLKDAAKKSLSEFSNILKSNADMDVAIFGHTDKAGSLEANQKVSKQRAQSVQNYLNGLGVSNSQIVTVEGKDYQEYDDAKTAAENRRVEVYLYASKEMIEAASNGTLQ
ncbi:MAG: OmpA family protein [Bacteroidaceae bacterium]|nr:OmpA family protein [Bacteroidaceae bacterium]